MTQQSDRPRFIDLTLKLMHSYMGLFIAPFIFIAALTGVLYGLTPQFENYIYQRHLQVSSGQNNAPQALSAQVGRAQQALPNTAHIMEVRPASSSDATTRVLYMDSREGDEMMALFINPYTLGLQGRTAVYGKSGVLPLRAFLDHLHRDLLLGSYGRIYSELAASWLGIFAITGLVQWYRKRALLKQKNTVNRPIRWHIWVGLCVLPMMLFFSVTGLTWSNWAGGNIAQIRHLFNSDTPTLNLRLDGQASISDPHAEHGHASGHHMARLSPHDLENFDRIVNIARANGLTASALRIMPSDQPNERAWSVQELQLTWPTRVDALAVDMRNDSVVDHTRFADYPLSAKLTRWGVDLHIGVLFGWVNQLVLVLSGMLILIAITLAYFSWFSRVGFKQIFMGFHQQLGQCWRSGNWLQLTSVCAVVVGCYYLIPLWTLSVLVFHTIAALGYLLCYLKQKYQANV